MAWFVINPGPDWSTDVYCQSVVINLEISSFCKASLCNECWVQNASACFNLYSRGRLLVYQQLVHMQGGRWASVIQSRDHLVIGRTTLLTLKSSITIKAFIFMEWGCVVWWWRDWGDWAASKVKWGLIRLRIKYYYLVI